MKRTHVVSVCAALVAVVMSSAGTPHPPARATEAFAGIAPDIPLHERVKSAPAPSRSRPKAAVRKLAAPAQARPSASSSRSTTPKPTTAPVRVAPAPVAPSPQVRSAAESRATALANGSRTAGGLRACTPNSSLASSARNHSAAMARRGAVYHSSDAEMYAALDRACPSCAYVGEVVGVGTSVDAIHRKLMASSTHRATIMNGRYRLIGSGVVFYRGLYWVTEIFAG